MCGSMSRSEVEPQASQDVRPGGPIPRAWKRETHLTAGLLLPRWAAWALCQPRCNRARWRATNCRRAAHYPPAAHTPPASCTTHPQLTRQTPPTCSQTIPAGRGHTSYIRNWIHIFAAEIKACNDTANVCKAMESPTKSQAVAEEIDRKLTMRHPKALKPSTGCMPRSSS